MDRALPVVTTVAETAALRALRPTHGPARAVARTASTVSERGVGWMAISAALAASPRTRRAGAEGLAAWAAASAAAFGLKRVVSRPRPRFVPRIGPAASSSSMPSSHTAGAVAYATAATLAAPALGAGLAPAAAAVAWSRAATARHFPTDVAVGALVGATAGVVVHLVGRRRDPDGARGRSEPADHRRAA